MGSAGLESRYCQSCVPPGDSGRKSSSFYHLLEATIGLPRWLSGKEPGSQCRRHGCDPWIRKIPWRRKWQPTPVFLAWRIPWTEEPGRLLSMESQRLEHDWVAKGSCAQAHTCTHTHHHIPWLDAPVLCLLSWWWHVESFSHWVIHQGFFHNPSWPTCPNL